MARLAAERGKPIVMIKIGRSELGARAARSHTAALTGSDALYDAVFAQYGVVRVQSYDELLEVSHLLAHTPKPSRPGIAVVSHSEVSARSRPICAARLALTCPRSATRRAMGSTVCCKGLAGQPIPLTSRAMPTVRPFRRSWTHMINEAASRHDGSRKCRSRQSGRAGDQPARPQRQGHCLPVDGQSRRHGWVGEAQKRQYSRILRARYDWHAVSGTCSITTPGMSAAWLTVLAVPQRSRTEQEHTVARLRSLGRVTLSESESKHLIAAWGIPVTQEVRVNSADAAVEAAQRLGYPVVLKVDSPDILHKTEAGVVRLGVRDAAQVRTAYADILARATAYAPNATISGVLVQEMVTEGVEVIVGVSYDAQLGPTILFGSGGVMVEVYNDVALRRCPITQAEARTMLSDVKGRACCTGSVDGRQRTSGH